MPFYEVTGRGLVAREPARFAALGMSERGDLQRLLRDDLSPVGDDLLVIAEEFGEWEDARRRIDLLAIDRSGRLVVIELKRVESGGHMDLQAIRYAAMVSSMDFDDVAETFARHLRRHRPAEADDATRLLNEFLGADDESEATVSTDVRIVLVAPDFGREITTTVLWLNGFEGMDIRCVRVVPYEIEGRILLDVEQVLPLPEVADYQVRIRRKEIARERVARSGRDYTKFHVVVDGDELPAENKRNAIRVMVQQVVARGAPIDSVYRTVSKRMKILSGIYRNGDEVRAALESQFDGIDLDRWFTDSPLVNETTGTTYVLTNQWGEKTEDWLQDLAETFAETKVTFRRAEG
ncbi:MAG: hypothetical protein M3134_03365 [Actinomycetota bacterium]|nr:hypothetical protein [Actinomycetota bacterium]